MKIRLSAGIACPALIALAFWFVSESRAGEYGGSYLRLPLGVEAMGQGGAYTASASGVGAAWWNPARLAGGGSQSILLEIANRSLGRSQKAAGYYRPLPGGAGVGLVWLNGTVGDIDGRDRNGEPTEAFSSSENSFLFAFGLAPHPNFRAGLAVKSFYHRLASEGKATGVGFDFGVDFRAGEYFSAAFVVQDMAASVNWDTGDLWGEGLESQMDKVDRYPLTYRTGIALTPPDGPTTLAIERRWGPDIKGRWHLGVSHRFDDSLVLRVGLVGKRVAAGGSLRREIFGRGFIFGCAWYPDEFDIRSVWTVGLNLEL
ncbi:hypothetical protein ACFLT7_07530 [candidate division KSB1 bacterium]